MISFTTTSAQRLAFRDTATIIGLPLVLAPILSEPPQARQRSAPPPVRGSVAAPAEEHEARVSNMVREDTWTTCGKSTPSSARLAKSAKNQYFSPYSGIEGDM
jgi:hypothetical protein